MNEQFLVVYEIVSISDLHVHLKNILYDVKISLEYLVANVKPF